MAATAQRPELIVITGPTASGKSVLAIKIAKVFDGEIVTADSRTLYKGLDIGTAKPTDKQRHEVPHWGLDLIEPGERFSAHQFKQYAHNKIKEINSRSRLPILVGGTGLYIDSVIYDFEFGPAANERSRQLLESQTIPQLQRVITRKGYPMPRNDKNKRHLIRAIEKAGRQPGRKELRPNVFIIGLDPGSDELKQSIDRRVEKMFAKGFIDEVKSLLDHYGEDSLIRSGGIGYLPALCYLKGEITIEEAKALFKKGDWQYARRQRTWFRGNPFIHWYTDPNSALTDVKELLNK